MDTMTVLLADDHREIVDSLTALLQLSGCAVLPAYSVREALDLLDEPHKIDVVVSDIRMPDADGFDLFRVLRHRFPTLPVILMTGLPITSDDVIPLGVTILEKPVGIEQLERAIAEVVERKRSLATNDASSDGGAANV
jgi:DNA-binding NtrC family response regulator